MTDQQDVVLSTYRDLGYDRPYESHRCHALIKPTSNKPFGGRCSRNRENTRSWVCHQHLGQHPTWIGMYVSEAKHGRYINPDLLLDAEQQPITLADVQDRLAAHEADQMQSTLLTLRKKLRERPVTQEETRVCDVCGAYKPEGGVKEAEGEAPGVAWICVDYDGCIERVDRIAEHQTEDDVQNRDEQWTEEWEGSQ